MLVEVTNRKGDTWRGGLCGTRQPIVVGQSAEPGW